MPPLPLSCLLCLAISLQTKAQISSKPNVLLIYTDDHRAYRKGAYKLIEYVRAPDRNREGVEFMAGSRVTQLFNLAEDPWETFNLADFPEYKERLTSMRSEMQKKSVELDDGADGKRTEVDFWTYY